MTKIPSSDIDALAARHPGVIDRPLRQRFVPIAVALVVLAYVIGSLASFDVLRVLAGTRTDLVNLFFLDSYAHKIHVVRQLDKPDFVFSLEGSRFAIYDEQPSWFAVTGEETDIDLGSAGRVHIKGDVLEYYPLHEEAAYRIKFGPGLVPQLIEGQAPEWMRASDIQIDMRPSLFARIWITKSKIEIHRYFIGWENFWFDFESPLNGKTFSEISALAVSADRLDPSMANWQLILSEFWNNQEWQHGEVYYALLQTIIMALVGTLVAGILALPLAFAAAANINPVAAARFGIRRIFDVLRGLDTLIWSLIFIRAFGLGPLSGIFAIFTTDTGALGKLFSEAIENADRKQAEGIQATGASPVQKYRFGVFPQILPVFISQLLYFMESNTRSATVIGALGAGGIGLKLLETMRTRQDWENTAYIIALIILVVIAMDNMSGWLRRKLIEGAN
ncbi:phosphonate ABC transporter, permease protein PhnE [Microvirga tunisiensis]|uniref:Phosphonate ABC transporter, permease protein PhnE n=2 Tax=Pannonibacter tanglangensis TaxID=2750084 RepID=A0ABW9ZD21_9HYPH|nr:MULTISPECIES: phosphonate ABC transporter, permease protein PhnE [unclassified Pannonibacter]NBN62561.1 phosphonate ABC transporter, permease protein PhnE [Pannonibacter sp. XCT-34]NBN78216.1 phosphonate ABC transporter, permease protein PhnE [Pannonibacter sp. XCT-53]